MLKEKFGLYTREDKARKTWVYQLTPTAETVDHAMNEVRLRQKGVETDLDDIL